MNDFAFYSPTRFVFGRGAENKVGALVKGLGGTIAHNNVCGVGRAWLRSIGMPQTFKELGAKEEDIPKLVATLGLKGNTLGAFRPLADEDVTNILRIAAGMV